MKLILAATCAIFASLLTTTEGKNVVCYYASWTVYRPGNGKFDIPNIDTSLCTHINFGFIGLNVDGTVQIIDPWQSNDDGLKGFRRLVALKEANPHIKILVSMGGWNEGSAKYSDLAADPAKRKVMAQSVLSFLEEYKFDGFDLDWEYPGSREGSHPDVDAENFVELLKDLTAVLKPKYLLTAAVSGGVKTIDIAYNVPKVSQLLDFINVMVYDFHGHFEPYVGHVAPLYKSSLDIGEENQTLNVAAGIEHWLKKGAHPSKLNLGVVTYGRAFTLADPKKTQLFAPVKGGGHAGPYTRQDGFLGYNEICELHKEWTYYWDDEQKVPHRISGDQWVGYEDTRSIAEKVKYAKSHNLGGMMMWAFDTDDFRGICGVRYPLLRAINKIRD